MKAILVLHGPNLNLLGVREPEIYGQLTLEVIDKRLLSKGKEIGLEVRCRQSNHEGELIDCLHDAMQWAGGVLFNPAAYTHTSIALRDAVAAIRLPVIEVHLSNTAGRESFRRTSMIAPVCRGVIAGFGWRSYLYALLAMADLLTGEPEESGKPSEDVDAGKNGDR